MVQEANLPEVVDEMRTFPKYPATKVDSIHYRRTHCNHGSSFPSELNAMSTQQRL